LRWAFDCIRACAVRRISLKGRNENKRQERQKRQQQQHSSNIAAATATSQQQQQQQLMMIQPYKILSRSLRCDLV